MEGISTQLTPNLRGYMHFDREVPVKVSSDQKMPRAGQEAVGKASKGPWGHHAPAERWGLSKKRPNVTTTYV